MKESRYVFENNGSALGRMFELPDPDESTSGGGVSPTDANKPTAVEKNEELRTMIDAAKNQPDSEEATEPEVEEAAESFAEKYRMHLLVGGSVLGLLFLFMMFRN